MEWTFVLPRILVVDGYVDAAVTLTVLIRLLRYVAEVVHDGHSALELIESFRPSLVLLEPNLPDISGFEVARRIRQVKHLKSVGLVAMTAWEWDEEEDRGRSREAGFDLHLLKPIELSTLVGLLPRRGGPLAGSARQ